MGRLFGTDGARGIANVELTCELAMNIGRAAALVIGAGHKKQTKIVIGKDTRISSDMLEGALVAGVCSVGADVISLGVIPTPAVAYLVGKYKADAGIMISASHNPYEFNGIKIFSGDGYKIADELEEQIEDMVLDCMWDVTLPVGESIGKSSRAKNAIRDYVDHIKSTVPFALTGMRIAFDCSNGAASGTVYSLFSELGAECHMLFDKPDGININEGCGSVHMDKLIDYVRTNKLDVGIAFDGDADRCLAVDEEGNLIDGDFIMAICAADLKSRGKLEKNTVVGTVMTNMGFGRFCDEMGMKFTSTNVGDKYVLEAMLREGYNFGGEQSGHVIFRDFATTGDGQLTAAQLLSIVKRRGARLSSLSTLMTRYPQVIKNVEVSSEGKLRFYTDSDVKEAIEKVKEELLDEGRIVVRISGTEPLVRIMVEGPKESLIEQQAGKVADIVKERLN